ncbi:hypothetical protein AC579_10257 [Pseudocercospora musae]|uniref:Uncharacterized protein n=1 Tax=Pseudocercospora musae TaxID=113226 RepID=A0A139HZA1_9PEZI|nr:hypothetical protein AC579_10257 [Pseudocercospora musae]
MSVVWCCRDSIAKVRIGYVPVVASCWLGIFFSPSVLSRLRHSIKTSCKMLSFDKLRTSIDGSASGSDEHLLGRKAHHCKCRAWIYTTSAIALQAIILVLVATLVVFSQHVDDCSCSNSVETEVSTDYGNLKDTIDLVQLAFVNPIQPTANLERLEIWRDRSTPDYGGPPSPEVDSAWAELLKKVTFNLSLADDVAKPAIGNTYELDGRVTIGIEVYHALHCLDILRVMLYPEYYSDNPILHEPLDETSLHRSHCIDYLRQYVQCNVDLTPMYWYKVPHYDKLLLRPGTLHTCRNFDQLSQWISSVSR